MKTPQVEYKVIRISEGGQSLEEALNYLAQLGWRLVNRTGNEITLARVIGPAAVDGPKLETRG